MIRISENMILNKLFESESHFLFPMLVEFSMTEKILFRKSQTLKNDKLIVIKQHDIVAI